MAGRQADGKVKAGPDGPQGTLYVLDDRQRRAVDMLAAGDSHDVVADAVGVTRDQLDAWRLYHPAFQAALNRANSATWSATQARVRALLPRALDRIADALDDPKHGPGVALALVRLAGVVPRTGLEPHGRTDPVDVMAARQDAAGMELLTHVGNIMNGPDLDVVERDVAARMVKTARA